LKILSILFLEDHKLMSGTAYCR